MVISKLHSNSELHPQKTECGDAIISRMAG